MPSYGHKKGLKMSVIENYNLSFSNLFKLEIPDANHINYFVQSCNLPSITMNQVNVQNRHHQAYVPNNHVTYSDLNCTLLMDENMDNYQHLHNWMRSFIDDDDWRNLVKDITLFIMSANKKILLKFLFVSAFPTSLSDLTFDSAVMDATQITYSVTFAYQHFTFQKFT